MEYVPDAETVLRRLVPRYVETMVWQALLESAAGEHGARMTAMKSATDNANELAKELTLADEQGASGPDHERDQRDRGGRRGPVRRISRRNFSMSESGQEFNRTTFGNREGVVEGAQTDGGQATEPQAEQNGHEERGSGVGTVVEVKGPVVDVRFSPEDIPEIYNALTVPSAADEEETQLTLEVQQLLGDDMVRTVAMSSTDGLQRGLDVTDTGQPIAVPVGKNVLGRVLDVLGQPVDERVRSRTRTTTGRYTVPRRASRTCPRRRSSSSRASRS